MIIHNFIFVFLLAEINSETESQTGNSGSEDNVVKDSGKSNSLTNGPTNPRNSLASAKRASSTKKVKNRWSSFNKLNRVSIYLIIINIY